MTQSLTLATPTSKGTPEPLAGAVFVGTGLAERVVERAVSGCPGNQIALKEFIHLRDNFIGRGCGLDIERTEDNAS